LKTMVIDGNSILNRAFYAVRLLTNSDGLYTNAIYGFLNTLLKLIEDETPDGVCVCFDLKAPTFRHKEFEGYKAQRKGMPDELAVQLEPLKKILDLMGILRLEKEGYEADDLIGTISRIASENGDECVIITGDRDSLQLVSDKVRVKIVSTKAGQPITTDFNEEKFKKEYAGLVPSQMIELKGLMGDSSDNIPGVSGIGETALKLISEFQSIENLYKNIGDESIRESIRQKLEAGRDMADLSRRLATIDKNVPIDFAISDAKLKKRDDAALYEYFLYLNFKTFIKKLDLSQDKEGDEGKTGGRAGNTRRTENVCDEKRLDDIASSGKPVALVMSKVFDLAALCDGERVFLVYAGDFSQEKWSAFLKKLFSNDVPKVMHDAKDVFAGLLKLGIEPGGLSFDTAIGSYLIDPSEGAYPIEKCAARIFACDVRSDKEYKIDEEVPPLFDKSRVFGIMAEHAGVIYDMYLFLKDKIHALSMDKLFYEIELPLVYVLSSMEHIGFKVDEKALLKFGEALEKRTEELTETIYDLAGEEFNINSTKKLGEILFDKLKIPAGKKTKTGYSTDIDVLQSRIFSHDIIAPIIEYRKLSKLKSTYVDGLVKVINKEDGRIHTTFNQMVTVTGRLSSTEPNLQNIPIREEIGSEIRRMFVAGKGLTLIDADYSQIELRILAHMADDEEMRKAFTSLGADIHTETAAQVFGVPEDKVTQTQRRHAKAVNFGIVYGISEFSLAQDIGVTRAEAAQYMKNYFAKYKGVKKYMDEIKLKAKEDGYVSTLLGRRRYLPELKSSNFNIRSFGERVALNMPIQGTAADIIKIAMVNVYKRLREEKMKTKLILQVHDELILEAPHDEKDKACAILKEEMERAYLMSVPLTVEVAAGDNWFDAKK